LFTREESNKDFKSLLGKAEESKLGAYQRRMMAHGILGKVTMLLQKNPTGNDEPEGAGSPP